MNTTSTLTIKNFGPVKELSVEIKPFMVFIGSQGTGKSTIAKVLTIVNDVLWYRTIVTGSDPMREFAQYKINKYFGADTYISYTSGISTVKYEDGKFSFSMDDIPEKDYLSALDVIIGETNKILQSITDKKDITPQDAILFGTTSRMLCYIPTERSVVSTLAASFINITRNKIPLPYTLLEYLALYEKAREYFTSYKSDILGVSYSSERDEENICVDKEQNKWLKLNECSSGIQSVMPMQMIIDYCHENESFSSYVVEEPEENLFPINQYELVKFFLAHYNSDKKTEFVINTHSPYLLTSLNVALLASKIGSIPEFKEEAEAILPSKYWISTEDIAVYALGDDEAYCQSVIDEKTGVISGNFLDSASEIIGNDFNKLYHLYIKSLKHGKKN